MRSKLIKVFYNSQTRHDVEMKLTSTDFSRRVAEGCRSSWPQTLGNQPIDRSPHALRILIANVTYCIIFVECVTESPVNVHVVYTVNILSQLETNNVPVSNRRIIYTCTTKHDMEMNLISIDSSCQVAEGCRSSWLQTLGNQCIDCSPYMLLTNLQPKRSITTTATKTFQAVTQHKEQ